MALQQEYQRKLVSAQEAVKVVGSGDIVDYGFFNGKPVLCDQALAARGGELRDVQVYAAVTLPPVPEVAKNPMVFSYHDFQYSKLTRMIAAKNPRVFYNPIIYHHAPDMLRSGIGPSRRAGFYRVCPMDAHGYFNLGPQNSETRAKMERDEIVVLEVAPAMPVCPGGAGESVHLSEVDFVVEAPADHGAFPMPTEEATPAEKAIAEHLVRHITDGAVIQLGIGGLPNQVGKLIAESDLKDLGGHTEMFCDAYVDMIESGRLNGRRKSFDRGRVAYTFALGSQRMYEFLHQNPAAASYPVEYTNDPRVIARHPRFISIVSALEVDLFGQVNAESHGARQISGNGGMWDFVWGAQWSEGGKSFICLTSTFTDHSGQTHSRIVPSFAPGSIVTVPRQMVDYVVTEYGAARLNSLPTWMRAEALIGLAHPDFREELVREAARFGIWRQSNKR
ncbi:MAG: acetyl-CoA hydrolase/transferase family protein [Acidobacteriota bacterium]